MLKCGNKEILAFFEKDHLRNFYNCDNIVNAGKKGYAIKIIHFYTAEASRQMIMYRLMKMYLTNW